MIWNYAYVLVMYKNVHTYYMLYVKRASTRTAIAGNTYLLSLDLHKFQGEPVTITKEHQMYKHQSKFLTN